MARIDANTCAKMVTDVAGHCAVNPSPIPPAEGPNLDGLVTAIAFGSAVIMTVTLVVVVLGIFVAVRWGQNVMREAKEEARREVEKIAPDHVRTYLDEKVPGMVADAVAAVNSPAGASGQSGPSAEDQARDLGAEPR
jgi:hypothetical protein